MAVVINDFTFDEHGSIFEIKFTDAYGDKRDIYQWYMIYDGARHPLDFIKMDGKIRILGNKYEDISLDLKNKIIVFSDGGSFPIKKR